VTGALDECEVEFSHAMKIEREFEAPRVTKPYAEEQWQAIEALGHAVDADLAALDVRMTMGGEPTFVATGDADAEEWNTTALGPTKRLFAADLFRRLRDKHAPQGLAHFGQGKWYPGEPLPRWSLNCFWRRDGEPMWRKPELQADERESYGADEETARRFLNAVAARLGFSPSFVFAAYEDVFYYLWRERRLPVNVDPFDSRLEDPLKRARLARLFSRGLERAAGFVLPIARDPSGAHWQSGPWFLRDERCHLVPGDSPIGYRLPLDSQPWVAQTEYPYVYPPDPLRVFPPLPRHAEIRAQLLGTRTGERDAERRKRAEAEARAASPPAPGESARWITRSAMCTQPRDGVLYLFMPPTMRLEDYLELVAAAEATAEEQSQPIVVEGYEPPADPRLEKFSITPDPGVIEVNIHPASRWDELVDRTVHLYEAARL